MKTTVPAAKTFVLEKHAQQLAFEKYGSAAALEAERQKRRAQQVERHAAARAGREARQQKVDKVLADFNLVNARLPRAVTEMVNNYVRSGQNGRYAQYSFDEVSNRLWRVRVVTSLSESFSKQLQNPVLRVRVREPTQAPLLLNWKLQQAFWNRVDEMNMQHSLAELTQQFSAMFNELKVRVRIYSQRNNRELLQY